MQVLSPMLNLQYRGMVNSDPVINMHHQITPIYYQVITLHTVHASINYDISPMDSHTKDTKQRTYYTRAPTVIYNISRHGPLSRPR